MICLLHSNFVYSTFGFCPVLLLPSESKHLSRKLRRNVRNDEATLARIKQTFCPIGDACKVIAKVKCACSKCRILLKQVVGLELADIHSARTTIAPPFYSVNGHCHGLLGMAYQGLAEVIYMPCACNRLPTDFCNKHHGTRWP
jgi:hypothetical protein